MKISPVLGSINRLTCRTRVDLPLPDSPMMQKTSPAPTTNDTSATASTHWKRARTSARSSPSRMRSASASGARLPNTFQTRRHSITGAVNAAVSARTKGRRAPPPASLPLATRRSTGRLFQRRRLFDTFGQVADPEPHELGVGLDEALGSHLRFDLFGFHPLQHLRDLVRRQRITRQEDGRPGKVGPESLAHQVIVLRLAINSLVVLQEFHIVQRAEVVRAVRGDDDWLLLVIRSLERRGHRRIAARHELEVEPVLIDR